MIDPDQLASYIVVPALEQVDLYSPAAAALLLATASQESALKYVHQLGNGPALGLWQMEPATHEDIWVNWLRFRWRIVRAVEELTTYAGREGRPPADEMVWNLSYAVLMARLHYRRVPEALPARGDRQGQARYWKRYYNTVDGAGTEEQFLASYRRVAGAVSRLPSQ